MDRGWLAEAARDASREADRKFDVLLWSYKDRPTSRLKRLAKLDEKKRAADLLYCWTQGQFTDKREV